MAVQDPLSLWERVRVRVGLSRFRLSISPDSRTPPHPDPLPEGEGDCFRPSFCLLQKSSYYTFAANSE